MENTPRSSESLRNVSELVKKIEGICKNIEANLAMCLEVSSDKVGSYSVTTAAQIESEFVDKIVVSIQKIRIHLDELKRALPKSLISTSQDVANIITSLHETSNTLNEFLLKNNFFYNNFQLPVMELQAAIEQIAEEVEVMQYA